MRLSVNIREFIFFHIFSFQHKTWDGDGQYELHQKLFHFFMWNIHLSINLLEMFKICTLQIEYISSGILTVNSRSVSLKDSEGKESV